MNQRSGNTICQNDPPRTYKVLPKNLNRKCPPSWSGRNVNVRKMKRKFPQRIPGRYS